MGFSDLVGKLIKGYRWCSDPCALGVDDSQQLLPNVVEIYFCRRLGFSPVGSLLLVRPQWHDSQQE